MGKWKRQYIIVEPGNRDVRDVAGHLRASLACLDRRGIDRPERDVKIENGRVHWDSGERLTGSWRFLEDVYTNLDVPCEWIVGITQHEVERTGGASLYTWIDGGLVPVETAPRTEWIGDRAGLRFLKKQWGVDPAFEPGESAFPPLPNPVSTEWDGSDVANETPPLARFATGIVDDEAIETREDARTTLADTPADVLESAVDALADRIGRSDGRDRIDALEQLYAAATASAVPLEVTPVPVLDLLDETGRAAMLGAAIVQELAGTDAVADLASDNPAVRRQAARYLGLEGASRSVGMSVVEALADEDPHVRAGVARALFRLAWSQLHRTSVLDGEVAESTLFEHLVNVVDDDASRVRAGVIPAVAFLAFHHDVGDEAIALSAVAAELERPTATPASVEWLLATYLWISDGAPSPLATVTAAAITALGEQVEHLSAAVPDLLDAEVLDTALAQLDAEGWDPADADTGTLAAIATGPDEQFEAAGRIGDVLLDRLAEDPLRVTEALVWIADDGPSLLDDAVSDLAALTDVEPGAATEALATVASEHPECIRNQWDTVEPVLAFDGEHARPAAAVVAALAAEDPDAVVAGTDDGRDIVSVASSVLYGSLDDPDDQARRETIESVVSLANADPSVVPPGIEPFVDRNDGRTDERIDEQELLAVVAKHDPDAAADALSSLLSSLDPSADSRQFRTLVEIVEDFPAVALELTDQLNALLSEMDRWTRSIDKVASAIGAAAEHDPTAIEPYVGTLQACLVHSRAGVRQDVARALAAVEQAAPGTLPPSLSPLADTDRGEDWPIDVLAESAPHIVEQIVRESVAAERPPVDGTAALLNTVAKYRPETAEAGVTRLVERADSVGYNSQFWSSLESVAESNPELVAPGLAEIVANTIESVDKRSSLGPRPARPLVVLAERYPRRVWALLNEHDPENDPTTLPERAYYSRVEAIEDILDAADPGAPLSSR